MLRKMASKSWAEVGSFVREYGTSPYQIFLVHPPRCREKRPNTSLHTFQFNAEPLCNDHVYLFLNSIEGLRCFQQDQKSRSQLRYTNALYDNFKQPRQYADLPRYIHSPSPFAPPGGLAAIGGKTVQLPSVISLIRSGNKSGAESRICSMGLQAS